MISSKRETDRQWSLVGKFKIRWLYELLVQIRLPKPHLCRFASLYVVFVHVGKRFLNSRATPFPIIPRSSNRIDQCLRFRLEEIPDENLYHEQFL